MKIAIKVGLVLGAVLLIGAWTAAVLAQVEIREEHSKHFGEVLGLTDTQMSAIEVELKAAQERREASHLQIQKLEDLIYKTAEQTGDPTAVGRLVLEKIALQKQVEGEEASFRESLNSILTPAQRDKLKQLQEANQLLLGWESMFVPHRQKIRAVPGGVPGGGGAPREQREHREVPPEK